MYSELNSDGSSSFEVASIQPKEEKISEKKNGSSINSIKTKSIKKNSDLRQSLIDDGSGHAHGNGNGNGNGISRKNGKSKGMASSSQNNGDGGDDDPYYVFKEDLLIKLDLVDDGLQRYSRLVKNTDTAVNTHEIKDSKKQLKRHIKNAESTLKDLQTTVRMVEKKRNKFPNIDDDELHERKAFTASCADRIRRSKEDMNSQAIKTKMLADERKKSKRRLGLNNTRSLEQHGNGNGNDEEAQFLGNEHATAQLMMKQQDETLDDLDDAVVRVGHMAGHIHEELGQQNKMLNEMEDDLQNAEEQLGLVMGKLGKLLKTTNKWQLRTIMILSLIVFILLFLVMYA